MRIPAIGDTPEAVWDEWRRLSEAGGVSAHLIVGWLVGEGVYSWRGGTLMREFKARARQLPHGYVATVRPATRDEVSRLWLAVERGWLQIEGRLATGCLGLCTNPDAGRTVKVYHQATGRTYDRRGENRESAAGRLLPA